MARRLEKISKKDNSSLDEVALSILEENAPPIDERTEETNPFDVIDGILDYDITHMSSTVKETLRDYFKNKHGRTD